MSLWNSGRELEILLQSKTETCGRFPKQPQKNLRVPPSPPLPPVSWMHSPLRWGSRPRSRTLPGEAAVEQTDYWLTDGGAAAVGGRDPGSTDGSWRELEGEGRIFQSDDWSGGWAVSPPTSPHPSSLCPCLLPFPPTEERRQPGSGAKAKLDSHIFSIFFCLLSCISVWLNLALVWLKSTTLGNFFLFALFSLS